MKTEKHKKGMFKEALRTFQYFFSAVVLHSSFSPSTVLWDRTCHCGCPGTHTWAEKDVVRKSPLVFPTSSPSHFCRPVKTLSGRGMTQQGWEHVTMGGRKNSQNGIALVQVSGVNESVFWYLLLKKSFPTAVSVQLAQNLSKNQKFVLFSWSSAAEGRKNEETWAKGVYL